MSVSGKFYVSVVVKLKHYRLEGTTYSKYFGNMFWIRLGTWFVYELFRINWRETDVKLLRKKDQDSDPTNFEWDTTDSLQ